MPQANVVGAWITAEHAYMAARVAEPAGATEYVGRVPRDEAWEAMSLAQKKAALVAAVKAVREASLAPAPSDLGITGSVSL